jgi:hypothetical protein
MCTRRSYVLSDVSRIASVCLESHANAVSVQIQSMRVVNVSRADGDVATVMDELLI